MRHTLFFLLISGPLLAATPDEAIVSHIRRRPVDSSAIAAIGYSKKLRALEIEFRDGRAYRYLDVPVDTYRELMAATSKARYYDAKIRHHFVSVHVRPPPDR